MDNNINMDVINEIDAQKDEIWTLATQIWNLNEISLEEQNSSALSAKYLENHGFKILNEGIGGLDYSWVAVWGSGKPIIGFTVEFDALPGLGNEAVPKKTLRSDGNHNGHGCGHNLIGSGSICAAVALKNYLDKHNINATIKVFGCPAEEVIVGKNFMAQDGAFDDLDACLHFHPMNKTTSWNTKTVTVKEVVIEFFGKSSHAGLTPWDGRSATHAAEIFIHGVNVMREQMLPQTRVHYLIEKAGEAVNVISDYSKINLTYRGTDVDNTEKYIDWIKDIAQGAGLITQTKSKFTDVAGCYDLLPNQTLSDRVMHYLNSIGAPKWTAEEQEFAKQIQSAENIPLTGLDTTITPDPKGMSIGGATDVGDISYITPTMGVIVACWPQSISPHTWGATACNGMSIGRKGMTLASQVLALTALDLIIDHDLLNNAKKEFLDRSKGVKYKSLCPVGGANALKHRSMDDMHDAIHHI